ncbi:MAG: T9SS type A sorting domain-containing protein [Saprospiraceae bacterium]|nr:T9SS type A sorting domain-containing protein [Saprospiraceae bacterium]
MKIHQTLSLLIITLSLRAQSLTYGSATTLFDLETSHTGISQPMIPVLNADGKHLDFYGLSGKKYRKYLYGSGNYPGTNFSLFTDFDIIIDAHDYDGDGMVDIVTESDIFRSKASNVYERVTFASFSEDIEGVLDYDGDGRRDVLVTMDDGFSNAENMFIYRNKGNFTFEKITVEQKKRRYATVFTADLNGDKRDDIIASTGSDGIPFVVFISKADGTFTTREILGGDNYYRSHTLSARDMDKDGDLDLVVMDFQKGLRMIENRDQFATTAIRSAVSLDNVTNGLLVHCDDINGDGWPDMIVATLTAASLTIHVGKGTGPFQFEALKEVAKALGGSTGGFAPRGLAVSRILYTRDINADGKKDIILTSGFDKEQKAWLNTSVLSSHQEIPSSDITLFPNPAGQFLYFGNDDAIDVSVYDIKGSSLLQKRILPHQPLDIHILKNGAYIAYINDERGRSSSLKFLKE